MQPQVSLVKCNDYESVKDSIKKSLELIGGLNKFVKPDDKVLLKPNLLDPFEPDKAATTHPLFLKAVIELVQEITSDVFVGDSSGGNVEGATKKVYKVSGIQDVVESENISFKDLQLDEYVSSDVNNVQYNFSKFSLEVDVIINLPKLKTHGITFLTGCIKNMFGCVNHDTRQMAHRDAVKDVNLFGKHLINIYNKLKPKLNIMDAVIGMEGNEGPSYGDPKKIGLVIASEDGVALDSVSARVTGHNPLAIPTIGVVYNKEDIDNIEVIGENISDVSISDFKQHTLFRNPHKGKDGFGRDFVLQPLINTDKCTRCKVCIKSCPVDAILTVELDGKETIVIDEKKCIQCYCCQEVCEYRAVDLEKKMFNKRLAPYLNDNKIVTVDKEEEAKFVTINLNELSGFDINSLEKNKQNLISIKLTLSDLNRTTGAKILSFLDKLNNNKINYHVTKPLPKCIFRANFPSKLSKYNMPNSCNECLELFTFQDKSLKICSDEVVDNEGIMNRTQMANYLITRPNIPDICMRCFSYRRNQCVGICDNYLINVKS